MPSAFSLLSVMFRTMAGCGSGRHVYTSHFACGPLRSSLTTCMDLHGRHCLDGLGARSSNLPCAGWHCLSRHRLLQRNTVFLHLRWQLDLGQLPVRAQHPKPVPVSLLDGGLGVGQFDYRECRDRNHM